VTPRLELADPSESLSQSRRNLTRMPVRSLAVVSTVVLARVLLRSWLAQRQSVRAKELIMRRLQAESAAPPRRL
jgi:hypothetical protein